MSRNCTDGFLSDITDTSWTFIGHVDKNLAFLAISWRFLDDLGDRRETRAKRLQKTGFPLDTRRVTLLPLIGCQDKQQLDYINLQEYIISIKRRGKRSLLTSRRYSPLVGMQVI